MGACSCEEFGESCCCCCCIVVGEGGVCVCMYGCGVVGVEEMMM